jgi:hypothetical protein
VARGAGGVVTTATIARVVVGNVVRFLAGRYVLVNGFAPGAIQAAIDAVDAAGGGVVLVPPGVYELTTPIVLPRTYYGHATKLNGEGAVHLIGSGRYVTHLRGASGFPANRGLIEWAAPVSGRGRCSSQRIVGMTLRPWVASGDTAIRYEYHASFGDHTTQQWDGEIGDVTFEGYNAYHDALCDLQGNIWSGWFHDLHANTSVIAETYTTLLLKFGRGVDQGVDAEGAYNCTIERVYAGKYGGGMAALVDGKLVDCTVRDVIVGNVPLTRPAIALYNSAATTLSGVACEGNNGVPVVRMENCRRVTLRGGTIGSPRTPYSTDDHQIVMVACRGCVIEGVVWWPSAAAWTTFAPARRVTLDADCINCTVDVEIGNLDTQADTITDDGDHNLIRTYSTSGTVEEAYDGSPRTPQR